MKTWRNLFLMKILTRGKFYYDSGNVISISKTDNIYTGLVEGNGIYNVQVEIDNEQISNMSCSCPYAESGKRCKHMAAVLFKIEAHKKAYEKKPVSQQPVRLFDKGEMSGKYFDLEKLTKGWKISDRIFQKAKLLYENAEPERLKISSGYHSFFKDSGITLSARYKDSENEWRDPNICIDRDRILQLSCNCSRNTMSYSSYYYGGKTEPCEHIIMLIWKLRDYILKYNPGDMTDFNSSEFLKAFRRRSTGDRLSSAESGQIIQLVPRVEYDGDLSLFFRIGNQKLYVVKKLSELVDCVSEKKTYALGKSGEINFSVDRFSEESLAYYDMIERYVREENLRNEDDPRGFGHRIHDNIHLMGSMLDEFYDMFKDKSPELTIKTVCSKSTGLKLIFGTASPEVELNFEKNKSHSGGEVEGITVEGSLPELLHGAKYHYFFDKNCLNRIPNEQYEKLRILYDYSIYDNLRLKIGRKNLSEFYYNVLPTLRDLARFNESEVQFEEFIPPEPQFSFYLDAENSVPVCKPVVTYGDIEYALAEDVAYGSDFRNFQYETEVLDTVRKYFPEFVGGEFRCTDIEDDIFNLLEKGVPELLGIGDVHTTAGFDALKIKRRIRINVGVSIESDLMNLSVSTSDISPEELIEILKSYRRKKTYHRLRNGNFVSLDGNIAELAVLLDSIHADDKQILRKNIQIPAYRALYLDKMLELCSDVQAQRDSRFNNFVKAFKTVRESDFEPPQSLIPIMRSYQHYGHKWLRTVSECGFGAILADDMGLGKTLQMISVLLSAKESGNSRTSIVICPASLVYNWQEEFAKFAQPLRVGVVAGGAAERKAIIHRYTDYDVLVTSYDLFKRDIALYENKEFEYQIIDEAQNIKNQSTAASKSVKILNSKKRFALTGTPIENRLAELWSIFDYLMPGYLYSYEAFKNEFETPIVRKQDSDAMQKLRHMVSPFILRRLKTDVLKDLPEKIEEVRYAKFDEKQQTLYDGQVAHMKEMLESQSEEDFSKSKLRILAELTRIRQICCDPSLIFDNYDGESAKREACIDLITSAIQGNHKILVFSQFTSMFELLEKDFKENGITYFKITGETDKKQRLELVKKFNSDSTNVFLISLKAGGTGLNLTGADVVIHYDPWWNIAAQNQATDRAHRIGQEKIVSVYKLIVKGSIEEKILDMQKKKKELADAVITGNAGQFTSMSKEDIIKLLR